MEVPAECALLAGAVLEGGGPPIQVQASDFNQTQRRQCTQNAGGPRSAGAQVGSGHVQITANNDARAIARIEERDQVGDHTQQRRLSVAIVDHVQTHSRNGLDSVDVEPCDDD